MFSRFYKQGTFSLKLTKTSRQGVFSRTCSIKIKHAQFQVDISDAYLCGKKLYIVHIRLQTDMLCWGLSEIFRTLKQLKNRKEKMPKLEERSFYL